MNKSALKVIGAIVIIILIVWAIAAGSNKSASNYADNMSGAKPIKIGASLSLTGVAADFGDMSKKAMELAVEEINANGGINGRRVELIIEDDQTDPKIAPAAYQKLVSINKVDAVIGGLFDFTAQPLFPIALKDKTTFISPVNFVIPKTFEMNEYSFVMYPQFEKVVYELGSVIKSKDIKKLGMIRYESVFSESIQNTLKKIMQNDIAGGSLVTDTYKAIGSSDFRTNILKIKQANPDAVFLDMLDFDIIKYVNESEQLGFKKQIIAYTTLRDVLNKPEFDKGRLEGAIMLDWEVPSEEFIQRFQKKYGESPKRGGDKSYDAIYMLAEAIAATDSKSDVPKYIETHTFTTVNGSFNFTSDHAVDNIPIKVFQVEKGQLKELKSVNAR